MIRITTVAITLLLSACVWETEMLIERKFTKTYTTTVTRAVGPTTLTGARGTLPQPTPTDLNAVYLAPNGSDAGADGAAGTGVFAAPVLTIAKALAVMTAQPARSTTVVIRNGFAGALSFTETTSRSFNAFNMQVADGETATITATATVSLTFTTGSINGFYLTTNSVLGSAIIINLTSTGDAQNCYAFAPAGINNTARFQFGSGANGASVDYCLGQVVDSAAPGNTVAINNSVLLNVRPSGTTNQALLVSISSASAGTSTLNITRSIIHVVGSTGAPTQLAPIFIGLAGAGTYTLDINLTSSLIMANTPYLYDIDIDVSGKTVDILSDYCAIQAPNIYNDIGTVVPSVTIAETNVIDPLTPPLFVDGLSLFDPVPSAESYRLQAVGKSTPNGSGRYYIDSPLIDAGLAGVDVNPWDESTALTSAGYTDSFTIAANNEPSGFSFPLNPTNPTVTVDANGNPHTYNDGTKHQLIFNWDANRAAGADTIRQFAAMLNDLGTKRVYPRGATGDLWADTGAETGDFTATDASGFAYFTPDTLTPPMIENNWQGWWLELDGDPDQVFYIAANDSTTFTLVLKEGYTEPITGNYPFAIRFMLVASAQVPVVFNGTPYKFFDFSSGQRWRETTTTSLTNSYEWQTSSLELLEAEDDEEAV